MNDQKKVYITWEEISQKLQKFDTKGVRIYGVPKGGMIAAGFLQHATNVFLPEDSDIILDDIIDSGATYEYYQKKFPEKDFQALFHRKRMGHDAWIVFPWEADHPAGEESVQQNIVRSLQYLGEDVSRPGLLGTPDRVVKMWGELFRGYDEKSRPKVSIFKNGTDGITYDQMITDTGDFYSHCEHHLIPFFGKYWFGYIPSSKGGIIGLSKIARIIDYHSAKFQIQERLVHDIVEHIWRELTADDLPEPLGMGLVMKGKHLCKIMRGVKKKGGMKTKILKGVFLTKQEVRAEFLNSI